LATISAGPNHTLPTAGTARFFSVLGVYDFMKKSSVIQYNKKALEEAYRGISLFAKCEELNAHANAVDIRFEEKKDE
jgi:histidinol dehydrogenase